MGQQLRPVVAVAAMTFMLVAVGCSGPASSIHNPAAFVEGEEYAPVVDPATSATRSSTTTSRGSGARDRSGRRGTEDGHG
jgi:hypothetical protein